jgi:uncharacterized membrane protein
MPNIHPIIVHFPIALIVVVAIFDLIGLVLKKKRFVQTANILTVFAVLGTIMAVASGLLAAESVWHTDFGHELLETHETVGFIFTGILVVLAIFRFAVGERLFGKAGWIAFVLSMAAAAVVAYGSYLGGEMVYRYGTGVKEAQVATARADSLQFELEMTKGEGQLEQTESVLDQHEGHDHAH